MLLLAESILRGIEVNQKDKTPAKLCLTGDVLSQIPFPQRECTTNIQHTLQCFKAPDIRGLKFYVCPTNAILKIIFQIFIDRKTLNVNDFLKLFLHPSIGHQTISSLQGEQRDFRIVILPCGKVMAGTTIRNQHAGPAKSTTLSNRRRFVYTILCTAFPDTYGENAGANMLLPAKGIRNWTK